MTTEPALKPITSQWVKYNGNRYWLCGSWPDGTLVLFDMSKEHDNSFRVGPDFINEVETVQ